MILTTRNFFFQPTHPLTGQRLLSKAISVRTALSARSLRILRTYNNQCTETIAYLIVTNIYFNSPETTVHKYFSFRKNYIKLRTLWIDIHRHFSHAFWFSFYLIASIFIINALERFLWKFSKKEKILSH